MNACTKQPSELKLLLDFIATKNYLWKGFLRRGSSPKFLLENRVSNQEVVGKITSSPSVGELKIWPKLQHRNLNRLLESLVFEDEIKILISPAVGKCIADLIQDDNFIQHPQCFDRKKLYAKDILLGLNYLHLNSVFLLNLRDENVAVSSYADKAVICDFSYTVAQRIITKKFLPIDAHYKPPEVQNAHDGETFDSSSIDMWDYGILILQIFTQYLLPWRGVVKESLELLDRNVLRKANVGAHLQKRAVLDLKAFLGDLLSHNPDSRPSAEEAFLSDFIQSFYEKLNEKARRFSRNGEILNCPYESNGFLSNDINAASPEIDAWRVSKMHEDVHHTGAKYSKGKQSRLFRIKSEPNVKKYQEMPNTNFPVQTISFPALSKNSIGSLMSSGESVISGNAVPEFETAMSCNETESQIDLKNYQEDNEMPNTYHPYDRSSYDDLITEWEEDIFRNTRGSSELIYSDLEKQAKNYELSNNPFAFSLDQVLPQTMLKDRPNLDIGSESRYNPITRSRLFETTDSISYNSEPNIQKIRTGSEDDFQFEIKEQKSSVLNCGEVTEKSSYIKECTGQRTPRATGSVSEDLRNINSQQLVKDRDMYIESEMVINKLNEISNEGRKSPKRRKWYHRLCCGCKCKKKNNSRNNN